MSGTQTVATDVATALDPNAGLVARIEAIEDFALKMTGFLSALFPSSSLPETVSLPAAPVPGIPPAPKPEPSPAVLTPGEG